MSGARTQPTPTERSPSCAAQTNAGVRTLAKPVTASRDERAGSRRVTIEEQINKELRRIEASAKTLLPVDWSADASITRACLGPVYLQVWWGGEDVGEEATNFDLEHADKMLTLLTAIPDGAPLDEGEDGSLWEIILEAHACGFISAGRYLREHHDMRTPGEGE